MDTIKRILRYLVNLEWREKVQTNCTFCDRRNLQSIVYEDDEFIAVDNIRTSGQYHWLLLPKEHVLRDIEALNGEHLSLLHSFDAIKTRLLAQYCPEVPPSSIHAGYHRGRRRLWRRIFYPDIISIHHLHLHVIVRPHLVTKFFKYPPWLPLMWKSDVAVLREIESVAHRES